MVVPCARQKTYFNIKKLEKQQDARYVYVWFKDEEFGDEKMWVRITSGIDLVDKGVRQSAIKLNFYKLGDIVKFKQTMKVSLGGSKCCGSSPRNTAHILSETSRMDLHPAPGSFLQELHRSLLLVYPHAHDPRGSRALEETASAWPAGIWQLVECTGKYVFARVSAPTPTLRYSLAPEP